MSNALAVLGTVLDSHLMSTNPIGQFGTQYCSRTISISRPIASLSRSWNLVSKVSRCRTPSGSAARENGNNRVCKPHYDSNLHLSTLWNWTPGVPPGDASPPLIVPLALAPAISFSVFFSAGEEKKGKNYKALRSEERRYGYACAVMSCGSGSV
ncbi:hypothetical protein E2542_SST16416 [Spatholobus suberectus]|nr:hypothetical protein E2542_SST16416 [Spatholobus suberectus]